MNNANEGATPAADTNADSDPCFITKVGADGVAVQAKVRHAWAWKWEGGVWTDKLQCGTCMKEKVPERING